MLAAGEVQPVNPAQLYHKL